MKLENVYQRFKINYPVIINNLRYNYNCIYVEKSILDVYTQFVSEYIHRNCLINYIISYYINQNFTFNDLRCKNYKGVINASNN